MPISPATGSPGLSEVRSSIFDPSSSIFDVFSPTSPIRTVAGPIRVCPNTKPPMPITPATTNFIQQLISTPLTNLICVHLRQSAALLLFVIRTSIFFRHSDFVIRHFPSVSCRQQRHKLFRTVREPINFSLHHLQKRRPLQPSKLPSYSYRQHRLRNKSLGHQPRHRPNLRIAQKHHFVIPPDEPFKPAFIQIIRPFAHILI